MITRIISGGQTGVDIAALRAAKSLGIPTGGTMPKGWRTLAGPKPEYADLFGMKESSFRDWAPRTIANVIAGDVTLRIAQDLHSPGERCTLNALRNAKRDHFGISLDVIIGAHPRQLDTCVEWLRGYGRCLTINVAGNSEQTAPGIEAVAEEILRDIFSRCLA